MKIFKIFEEVKELIDKAKQVVDYVDENKDLFINIANQAKDYFNDAKNYLKKIKDTIGDETQVEPQQENLTQEKQETEKVESLPEPQKIPVYQPKEKKVKKTETKNNDVW